MFKLGWNAARYGDTRNWAAQYGPKCLDGFDAYWAEYSPE